MFDQTTLVTFFPSHEIIPLEIAKKPIIEIGRQIVLDSSIDEGKIIEFIDYASIVLKGNEKSEAKIFLERLFQTFGHKGIAEAGAVLEDRIKVNDKIKFPDLLWPRKVLIEMKSRGENLQNHFDQAKTYWDNAYAKRTEYVILCNFDEFWIYNWNEQKDPIDKVPLNKLRDMWRSLAFLCHQEIKPLFGNNLVDVTEKAAGKISELYKSLIDRGIEEKQAQRFTLQCLVALFAEDTGLFPRDGFFLDLIDDCINKGQSSYDLFRFLFDKMNSKEPESGGRFKEVRYFDGGIFSEIYPMDLNNSELLLLYSAAKENWSKVQPSIFGNIFEQSLDEKERHKRGSHYTYESDIMRIVGPTIIRPWKERIDSTKSYHKLEKIWDELSNFKILDPACGSGNFLYISFRELKALEIYLLRKMLIIKPSKKKAKFYSHIKASNFYGIDIDPFAIELAKITLSMAKKFAADEFNKFTEQDRLNLLDEPDDPLPFDNLDNNIICGDALFVEWPEVNAIIGNPPFQAKNKMQEEFGLEYINKIRKKIPGIPGKSDYCVYWFRKAHDMLAEGGRAGLVGTKTISQTNSRIGGLDYIVSHGGTILEAVARMPWSGKAAVDVSIVNWIKGDAPHGKRKLAIQSGNKKNGPWIEFELSIIPSSLSQKTDVTKAKSLKANSELSSCYQGQTHGHEGFLISPEERTALIQKEPIASEVTFPYLIADELFADIQSQPSRFVIDFQPRDIFAAKAYKNTFKIIEEKVLPARKTAYEKEQERNNKARTNNPQAKINRHHEGFYNRWWLLSFGRSELISELSKIKRYIACGQVTKRPIFEFVSTNIRPNAALVVFPLEDDYSFGILQSSLHWEWFKSRCSTLSERFRYTSDTVFDSFPWPQWRISEDHNISNKKTNSGENPLDIVRDIVKASKELRALRNRLRKENKMSLREQYRVLELPGDNSLRGAHKKLDNAVYRAYYYGLPKEMQKMDTLEFLLKLNDLCANAEKAGNKIVGPGLPSFCDKEEFISEDCIRFEKQD